MIDLYAMGSPNVVKIYIALEEMGLPYTGRIQLIVATRSLLAYRATRRPTPRSLTVTLDEFISIAGYHRKHVIWRRCFRRCWWPTNLDKHSAVLGLVQDEPALRAGAAGGILDKTCARRSAGGRSAPRNGPLSLTKECNLDLGSGEAASKAMVTSQHGQFRTSLDMADISNWSSASAGVCQASVFRGLVLRAAATAAMSSALCMLRSVPFGKYWRSSPLVFSLVPRCQGL